MSSIFISKIKPLIETFTNYPVTSRVLGGVALIGIALTILKPYAKDQAGWNKKLIVKTCVVLTFVALVGGVWATTSAVATLGTYCLYKNYQIRRDKIQKQKDLQSAVRGSIISLNKFFLLKGSVQTFKKLQKDASDGDSFATATLIIMQLKNHKLKDKIKLTQDQCTAFGDQDERTVRDFEARETKSAYFNFVIGVAYLTGQSGKEQNTLMATNFLTKAANQGSFYAMTLMSLLNSKEIEEMAEKTLLFIDTIVNNVKMSLEGRIDLANLESALVWIQEFPLINFSKDTINKIYRYLVDFYLRDNSRADLKKGVAMLTKLADEGDTRSQIELGQYLSDPSHSKLKFPKQFDSIRNLEAGCSYLQRAAEKNANAYYILASYNLTGITTGDDNETLTYLQKAAAVNNVNAIFSLLVLRSLNSRLKHLFEPTERLATTLTNKIISEDSYYFNKDEELAKEDKLFYQAGLRVLINGNPKEAHEHISKVQTIMSLFLRHILTDSNLVNFGNRLVQTLRDHSEEDIS